MYTAGTCTAMALIIGMSASLWQASVATRAWNEANEQRVNADAERERANQNERAAISKRDESRRLLYAADMKLAQAALLSNNLGRAASLLDRHRPSFEDQEPTFEWRYLWQQSQGDRQIASLRFPRSSIANLAFSPNDRWLSRGDK